MNKSYRSLYSAALGAWVAVPEATRARGKRSGAAGLKAAAGSMLALSLLLAPSVGLAQNYGSTGGNGGDGIDGDGAGGRGGGADQNGEAGADGADGAVGGFGRGGLGGVKGILPSPNGGEGSPGSASGGGGGGGGGGYSNSAEGNVEIPLQGGVGGFGGIGGNGFGGGGGGGGGGGDGVRINSSNPVSINAMVTGGGGRVGEIGGRGRVSGGGSGGGGGGGAGVVLVGDTALTTNAPVSGGNGGSGGSAGAGGAGGSGGGGAGVILQGAGHLTANAQITGGDAGPGVSAFSSGNAGVGVLLVGTGSVETTASGAITGGSATGVGRGGTGVAALAGGTIVNAGSIRGGNGGGVSSGGVTAANGGTGSGGASGYVSGSSSGGAPGGAGITGAGLTIINSGTIAGGTAGKAQANAVTFTGGTNSLELRAGYSIVGNVDATAGTSSTLILGGDTSPTGAFDASKLVSTATAGASDQYVGFNAFKKTGASTWTLTGKSTTAAPWTLEAGTLALGTGSALGTGTLTVAGAGTGTLSSTTAMTVNNAVILNANLNVSGSNAFTLSGVISGTGGLTKEGVATLTLTGANTFTRGTTINAGGLTLGNSAALGTGALSVIGNASLDTTAALSLYNNVGISGGANLVLLGSNALTLVGTVSGMGGIVKNGASTLTLTGANTFTGGTTINNGTLAIGADGRLFDEGAVTLANPGTGFDISAGGNQTIGLLNGVAGSKVNLGGYTLTLGGGGGDGAYDGLIAGTGNVVKNGAGTQELSGPNTFSGGVTLNAGGLTLGNNGALGTGALSVIGNASLDTTAALSLSNDVGISGGANLILLGSNALTLGGTVSGIGGIVKNGASTLTLTGANTFTGGSTINAGTLAIGAGGSLLDAGAVTLANPGAGFDISAGGDQTIGPLSGVVGSTVALGDNTLTVGGTVNSTFNGSINGSGGLVKTGAGVLTLIGANTFGGGTKLDGGGLVVGNNAALGTGALTVGGASSLDSASAVTLANNVVLNAGLTVLGSNALTLNGNLSGTGSLTKQGVAILTMNGTNTYSGGTNINAGTLLANNNAGSATGFGDVEVSSGATLGGSGTVGGATTLNTGAHLLGVQGQTLTLGALTLKSGANTDVSLGAPGTTALFQVNGNLTLDGTLNITDAGSFGAGLYRIFNYTGGLTNNFMTIGSIPATATLSNLSVQTSVPNQVNLVNTGGLALNVWDGAGPKNNGQVEGGSGTWSAAGANDNWTSTAGTPNAGWTNDAFAIFSGTPGTVTVDSSAGAVNFSGAQFAADGYTVTGGTLTTNTPTTQLRVGDGTDQGAAYTATIRSVIEGSGGLAKTDLGTLVLTGANTYTGGTTLNSGTLIADADTALGTGTLTINGGTLGGEGSLSNAVSVNGSFNVKLSQLELTGDVTLNTTPTITTAANVNLILAGAISGSHGLTFDSTVPTGDWTEVDMTGNEANTYTGLTTVQGDTALGLMKSAGVVSVPGDLLIQGNAVVGLLAAEQIADTATVTIRSTGRGVETYNYEGLVLLGDLADDHQVETIGTLLGNGSIGLGTGILAIGQGDFSGTIGDGELATRLGFGGGQLVKYGSGTLTLSGDNTYTGGTALKGGTLAVGNNTALGTGGLAMDDGTTLAFAADGLTLANPITLTGSNDPIFDTGSNTATLTGGITGAADVTKTGSGTLILGAANNSYSGGTAVSAGTLRAGAANAFSAASAHSVAAGATLATAGYSQSIGSLTNSGTVTLAGSSAGSTLSVNGNYVGNNGLLKLGTVLGDSTSVTDRLVVTGSASGSTAVQVTNLGGLGGQTTGNGIEIISAAGGIASDAFSLAGAVSAGSYDYHLNTAGSAAYLSSTTTIPETPTEPTSPSGPTIPTYRAEVPLYAALPEQLRQANLAMLGNLHQRIGDDGVTGASTATPEQGYRQAWGRVISIDRDIAQSGTVSPTSKGRLNGFQAGTDLWATPNWKAGLYIGQLDGDMSVTGFARGIDDLGVGSNDLRNQYLGVYGTYAGDAGFYADAVVQAARHRYDVNASGSFGTSGKGHSLLASIEVGQSFNLSDSGSWKIEPQLQLVHQKLNLDDSTITGALVQQDSHSGWSARAGVRIKGELQTAAGTVQPYGRFNFYKTSSGTDITRFIGPAASTDIATRTGGTSSELAAGATWQLSQSTSVYGEVGKLWDSGGDARTKGGVNGSLGVKVRW